MSKNLSASLARIRYSVNRQKRNVYQIYNEDRADVSSNSLFLPYQQIWFNDDSTIRLDVKSRQLGWTYTHAILSVFKAINGYNVIYNCYNMDSGKLFISLCTKVAKSVNKVFLSNGMTPVLNERNATITQIAFNNGFTISCIPSDPNSFRGKPGYRAFIIIDEAAFRSNLPLILKAALALCVWGGQIRIASTHNGKANEFNQLVKKINEGKLKYNFTKVTFKEAIEQGLYKKICVKNNEIWTLEKEKQWINEQYDNYGITATEELDCIPIDFAESNKIYIKEKFRTIDKIWVQNKKSISIRYWDFASSLKADSFYTASLKVSIVPAPEDETKTVLAIDNFTLDKKDATDVISMMRRVIKNDSTSVIQLLEKEPGSSSEYFFSMFMEDLAGYNIKSYTPKVKKILRAIPTGNSILNGKIRIVDDYWCDELIDILSKFSEIAQPGVTDLGDCLSGINDYYSNQLSSLII